MLGTNFYCWGQVANLFLQVGSGEEGRKQGEGWASGSLKSPLPDSDSHAVPAPPQCRCPLCLDSSPLKKLQTTDYLMTKLAPRTSPLTHDSFNPVQKRENLVPTSQAEGTAGEWERLGSCCFD